MFPVSALTVGDIVANHGVVFTISKIIALPSNTLRVIGDTPEGIKVSFNMNPAGSVDVWE